MDNTFIEKVNSELEKIYNSTNFENNNIQEELGILHKKFEDSIISFVKNYTKEAKEFYEKREAYSNKVVDPVNEKVKKIIISLTDEYKKKFNDKFTTQVASSYSSKMNLEWILIKLIIMNSKK